jgi:hypothetical protein
MSTPSLTWKQVLEFGPCNPLPILRKINEKFPDYQTRALTLADASDAGILFDNLVWIAGKADERRAQLFAADCAAHVSYLSTDPRSHEAIRCARLFARGEIGAEHLSAARAAASYARAAASYAMTAAWDAAWAARAAAAWAAAWHAGAAAWAAANAAAWAAMDAACDARDAASAAAAWDAARVAETQWQHQRLLAWFSDNEPEDWPIADAAKGEKP